MYAQFILLIACLGTWLVLCHAQCRTARVVVDLLDERSGFIENDKDDRGNYFKQENCLWTFSLGDYESLNFWFTKIDLEESVDCRNDYVGIYQGAELKTENIVGRHCSLETVKNRNFTTRSRDVFVLFRTNNNEERKGFRLNWAKVGHSPRIPHRNPNQWIKTIPTGPTTTISTTSTTEAAPKPCQSIRTVSVDPVRESVGVIESDGYGISSYADDQRCGWLFVGPEGFAFRFQFIDVDLELVCNDWVMIYDGTYDRSFEDIPVLIKVCGGNFTRGQVVESTGNNAFVVFDTDASVSGRGFRLGWQSFRQMKQTRTTPTPPPTTTITYSWRNFFNQFSTTTEDNSWLINQLTTTPVSDYDADLQKAVVEFYGALNSLRCAMTRQINADYTVHEGIIENDKDSDGNYYNNDNCSWVIHIPPGNSLRIDFQQVATSGCSDYVAVHDGPTVDYPLLTKQCMMVGPSSEDFNTSPGVRQALVHFHTDGFLQNLGFKLHWQLEPETPTAIADSGYYRSQQGSGVNSADQCRQEAYINADGFIKRGGVIENEDRYGFGRYASNENSCWKVTAPSGSVIQLHFTHMQLERSTGCKNDYVVIYDGPTVDSPVLTRQCYPDALWKQFTTTNSVALIQFRSDGSNEYEGFKLNWQVQLGAVHNHMLSGFPFFGGSFGKK